MALAIAAVEEQAAEGANLQAEVRDEDENFRTPMQSPEPETRSHLQMLISA